MDLYFVRPITLWTHADFSRFLFFSQCEPSAGENEAHCVADVLHTMSGADFVRWEPLVGPFAPFAGCFFPSWSTTSGLRSNTLGHNCYNVTARALGRLPGLVLPPAVWRPKREVRESSPVTHFILGCAPELNRS